MKKCINKLKVTGN